MIYIIHLHSTVRAVVKQKEEQDCSDAFDMDERYYTTWADNEMYSIAHENQLNINIEPSKFRFTDFV